MTPREAAIAKLQQLSEPLLREVSDFIDFIIQKHRNPNSAPQPNESTSQSRELPLECWERWFAAVDRLEITTSEPSSDYQRLLLSKYRQQGLNL
ncbi:hypothetical protein [Thermoleptolyngbya sp. C42_A2020_037]|uniref:hypothetical protein n=1 Tax=Thermoleptolyngbya sp. C42_A2020_037 TaxID=2747799 RepID=UPI0019E63F4B|nr:hypothetical protein [Thermoleptolyngbya sp. C42_A2020_037]MBF2086863.1 hypothetical protein [Thermoleptolyngbya sp. C42_A2020_037]